MIVGYSFFVGDLFHVGHLNQLELDRGYCDFLIVGVLTSEAVNYKPKPIIPLEERMRIFRALRAVDLVWCRRNAIRREPCRSSGTWA